MKFFRFLMTAAVAVSTGPILAAEIIDPANEPPVPRAAPVVKVMEEALPRPGGVLVFGGTDGAGLDIVSALAKSGEKITVMADPRANLEAVKALNVNVVNGDVLNRDDVAKAFAAAPFREAFSALNGTTRDVSVDYEGNRNVIDTAKAIGVPRIVLISAIGAGDSAPAAHWLDRMFRKTYLGEKTKAETYLRASGLKFTIVRVGALSDDASSGKATLSAGPTKFSQIAKSDFTNFLVMCLKSDTHLNKVLTAYDKSHAGFWEVNFYKLRFAS